MEHLGSLESTQEARVALGYRLEQLFFRDLQTSRVLHNFDSARQSMNQLLNHVWLHNHFVWRRYDVINIEIFGTILNYLGLIKINYTFKR